MVNEFEVTINGYDFALQQAHDEILEATGFELPADTTLTMELVDTDGDDLFYKVTLTGPHAAEVARAVNELQEPCFPPPEED